MSVTALSWAFKQVTGDPTAKLILISLADHADETGYCYPSRAKMAEYAEASVDTIDRRIQKLVSAGIIRKEARFDASGDRTSNGYHLNFARDSKVAADCTHPDLRPPSPHPRPYRGRRDAPTVAAPLRQEPSIKPSSEPSTESISSEFAEFGDFDEIAESILSQKTSSIKPKTPQITAEEIYDAYPKKVAKAFAIVAIKNSIKRDDPVMILAAVKDYAIAVKSMERRFVKHPATWFNGACYLDDPKEWNPPPPKSRAELNGKFVEKRPEDRTYSDDDIF